MIDSGYRTDAEQLLKAWPRVLGQAFVLHALVRTPLPAGRSRTTDATPEE